MGDVAGEGGRATGQEGKVGFSLLDFHEVAGVETKSFSQIFLTGAIMGLLLGNFVHHHEEARRIADQGCDLVLGVRDSTSLGSFDISDGSRRNLIENIIIVFVRSSMDVL